MSTRPKPDPGSTLHSRAVLARRIAGACGAGVLLIGAAGCGSADPAKASAGTTSNPRTSQNGTGQNGTGQLPGADGKVAALDGSTAQVQSQQNGQVAVTWSASTTFTQQISAKLADLQVGDCVMVLPTQTAASSSSGSSDSTPTKVTAATVRITEPVSGSCTPVGPVGPQGGPQVAGPGAAQGAPPTGALPNGDGKTRSRGGGGAFGEVTAVAASGFTVEATRPTSAASTKTTTTTVAVTTNASTTFTTTAKAAAADVKVGSCLRAQGSTDSTGAVAATTIALSPAVGGGCGGMVFRSRGGSTGTSGQAS